MTSLTEFFSRQEDDNLKGISHKNNLFKRNIIAHMAVNGECTLSELTKELHISVPTITKLVQELVQENIVSDLGKVETPGGRRPNVFGLASSAIYFAGVNIGRDNMSFLITDLHNNIVKEELLTDFELQDRPQCLEKICSNIAHFIDTCGVERAKILGVGVSVSGRVNPTTGRSYRYFTSSEQSLRDMIEQRIGIRVLLENDSRARCYAEYTNSKSKDEMDVLYLHLGRGLAIGIVMNGKLYYGKSGFAGEFGHIPFFDNEIICSCGKKGCLETEVSGIAIEQKFGRLISQGVNTILREKYNKHEAIHVDEIIDAAKHDDNLSIELIEEVGEKAGKAVAFLINTFNPETVIVGGELAEAGDYLMLPLKSATNKYSLNLVYKDTKFRLSKMGKRLGCCHVDSQSGARTLLMMLRGHICSLRAVEPQDLELLCRWENDPSLWTVSGTIEPFSHYSIEQFIQEQQAGIYRCGQLRLMIDDTAGETIGAIDLFDFEPQHERAGVGILVYDPAQRGKGYGAEALALLEEYARTVLRLRQLWCNVLADNVPSLTLFERAGFRRVGVKKEWIRTPEGYKDEVLLQKLL